MSKEFSKALRSSAVRTEEIGSLSRRETKHNNKEADNWLMQSRPMVSATWQT